ncbi:chromosome segregation protein SMC [Pelagibius sp. Alg239-R121]|uniref:chromosome segregation protein SMC n=1 Tax=Pelagibius sp. Alg239-R121 TaxID=2993448 RepID=UPI0024A75D9D|nr:chromosome segregation protein SMC [Pelagibius sp. Alg239-R121]
MVQFKKLHLSGFKSFVDPTDLLIERGMTGVVGPNGCGKSNLVEALRWVMGETSAKKMRGSEMDDVIFAGSATRPARNVAEVCLSLNNQDRKAPAMFNDSDELEVIRRITRGGGSNYKVNGKDVRARDVQLLFADAASGAHSTALVSQGRVGEIINAKPTNRRAILEEAAGITGLHSRRHEAELRLKAAETNLERLDDVIVTLEAQLASLKKQARQASRYRNIADHIRRNEAILFHLDAKSARQEVEDSKTKLRACELAVGHATQKTAALSSAQVDVVAAMPKLRQDEAEAAAALQRLLVDRENLDREVNQAKNAKAEAEQRLQQLEADRERAASLDRDAAAAQDRLEQERSELLAAAEGEKDAHKNAEKQRNATAEQVAASEQVLGDLSQRVAGDEANATALKRTIADLTSRYERVKQQAESIAKQRDSLQVAREADNELSIAEATLAEAEELMKSCRADAEACEQRLAAARSAESTAREAYQGKENLRTKLDAEMAALSAVLSVDGDEGRVPVVDKISVATGYEKAFGASLGDDLSASTDQDAAVHWAELPPLSEPPKLPQGVEPLLSKVTNPGPLARRLTQIGVVENAADGEKRQRNLAVGQRLVTAEGDLWRWDGLIIKADAPSAAAIRLEQRNRLKVLKSGYDEAVQASEAAKLQHRDTREVLEREQTGEREARKALNASFNSVNLARTRQADLAKKSATVTSRLAALDESAGRIEGDLKDATDALASAQSDQKALPDLETERSKLSELRADLAEKRARLAEQHSLVERLLREAEARAQRLLSIENEKKTWIRRAEESGVHIADLAQRHQRAQQEIEVWAAKPVELEGKRDALVNLIEKAEEKRKAAADILAKGETRQAEADRILKEAEQSLAGAREDRVRAESAVAQANLGLETIIERTRERLGCGLDEVLEIAELDPSQDLPARDDIENKLSRLSRERENIGPVNLRAEAEARELDEQIVGMQNERNDLIAAIARLRQGIASLNKEGRERLLAAFEVVDAHFSELFVRLFGGGRAHLKLTEADDPLQAGLEIMASPPGKRLQIMSLLSGGEQALTALSLLFAVFLTNPAPICVLDEVDAPLDDANVDRFCSLVEELTQNSSTRFLVISHHRMTMARVDRLFGVTMSERGISQLVSVDLEAAEGFRETA